MYDPLIFIHQFLQHLPPKNFQRLRYYGIHSSVTYKRVKGKLKEGMKREGDTIRVLFIILKAMLGFLQICEECGGTGFDKSCEAPDLLWLQQHVRGYVPKNKAPPNKRTYRSNCKENAQFSTGEAMPSSPEKGAKCSKMPELSA